MNAGVSSPNQAARYLRAAADRPRQHERSNRGKRRIPESDQRERHAHQDGREWIEQWEVLVEFASWTNRRIGFFPREPGFSRRLDLSEVRTRRIVDSLVGGPREPCGGERHAAGKRDSPPRPRRDDQPPTRIHSQGPGKQPVPSSAGTFTTLLGCRAKTIDRGPSNTRTHPCSSSIFTSGSRVGSQA